MAKCFVTILTTIIGGLLKRMILLNRVKNSILYQESNGIVEEAVNKVKPAKRVMYDRCGFELLKAKTLMISIIK